MPAVDEKITALDELAETPASGDLFAVVDVSDDTDAASGTSKKVTRANVIAGLATSAEFDDHSALHENGGADEISIAGLSGEAADPQPPKTHATDHQNGGADEINVAGLSGELADAQPPKAHTNTAHTTNLVGETGVISAMTEKTTPHDDDVVVIEDSEAAGVVKKVKFSNFPAGGGGGSAYPPNFISGFVPTIDTDTDHDINYGVGYCRNSANDDDINLSSAITKQIDATFAEGDDAGGLFSGASLSNGATIHAFAITKDADGTVDVGFDTSISGANVNTGWTIERRIHSFVLDASQNIIPFVAHDVKSALSIEMNPPVGSKNASLNDGLIALTGVPLGLNIRAKVGIAAVAGGNQYGRYSVHSGTIATIDYGGSGGNEWEDSPVNDAQVHDPDGNGTMFYQTWLWTDTSARIYSKAYEPNTSISQATIETREYWDYR